jgi:hypothetical protein
MSRTTSLAAMTVLALTGALLAPGQSALGSTSRAIGTRVASLGTLAVTPTSFVGGQSLTWTGKLPHRGVRTITMQRFLNRPGDSWIDVQDFKATTKADGSFSFHYPAPDMQNIGFRVKSGKYVTEKLDLYPYRQDVVLHAEQILPGTQRARATTKIVAGLPFVIVADTTPKAGMPVFPGRVLLLQRRVDPTTWVPVGTTVVGPDGEGSFLDLTQAIGTPVYRVLEQDWTKGDNKIGWYPSFPTYLDVVPATGRRATTRTTTFAAPAPSRSRSATRTLARAGHSTAALRWKWGYPIFDFDWTSGESLTSKPWRGSRPRGQWTEYLAGTGRVAKRSGQLGLASGPTDGRPGTGNRGTTATTLQGNAQRYGRWEVKLRTDTEGSGSRHYLVRAELVPERAADYDCGAHNVTIAEIRQGQGSAVIGAAKGTTRWTRTLQLSSLDRSTSAFGVELMKDHVTWFLNSTPVGTLEKRKVTGDVPMTLRLSLVGDEDQDMVNTTLLSDWQRAFPINRSPGVTSGAGLTRSSYAPTCG